MPVETALFFESVEQIYARVFGLMKPRAAVPAIHVLFRRYANANSRIKLAEGLLTVEISDVLESAPAPIQEALASILLAKLFRRVPEDSCVARYKRYLNRADVRRRLQLIRQERGRKIVLDPAGRVYDLCAIFEELNREYFHGLMARPRLGWSVRTSRTTLGHYDPSHHTIVLTNLLDTREAAANVVRYVMFHEMLHLRFPTEHRGARRCVHTREFKEAEKSFEGFREAQEDLKKFLEKSGGGC